MDRSWPAGRVCHVAAVAAAECAANSCHMGLFQRRHRKELARPCLCHECPFARLCPATTHYHRRLQYIHPTQPSLSVPFRIPYTLRISHTLLIPYSELLSGLGHGAGPLWKFHFWSSVCVTLNSVSIFPPDAHTGYVRQQSSEFQSHSVRILPAVGRIGGSSFSGLRSRD